MFDYNLSLSIEEECFRRLLAGEATAASALNTLTY